MRRFIATTFGDGALIVCAVCVVAGLALGIFSSASWLWLCLPIIFLIG